MNTGDGARSSREPGTIALELQKLLIGADGVESFLADAARYAAGAVPHARSVVLPDCGHVPQFELPEKTHALVREFLAELPTTPPGRPPGELTIRRHS